MPSPTQTQPQPQPTTPSPRDMIISGIINNSISDVRQGIDILSHSRKGFDPAWALSRTIKHAQPDMVRYLLDEAGATVDGLGPFKVGAAAVDREGEEEMGGRVESTWEALVERGWDINAREGDDAALARGECLLGLICDDERLVRWCLAHGASVTDPPDLDPFVTPPLLESVAGKGSVATFKLLHERGAQLGRRSLHRAVESAAFAAGRESRGERMAMVRYLVEECGADVNGMDVREGQRLPNHWGPPAAYAVHADVGEGDGASEVLGWLLERGADPRIKDCFGYFDVVSLAERSGSKRVVELLREWEGKHEKAET